MNILDQARIQWAISRYSWWLDFHHVGFRKRRGLCRELRANLQEAAARHGAEDAVARLGNVRRLAAETAREAAGDQPRWEAGLSVGLMMVVATAMVALIAALNWVSGAADAEPASEVHGSLFPFPGSHVSFDNADGGFSFVFNPGWLPFALGLITFVLVAKPWRLVTRRGATRTDGAVRSALAD